MPSDLSPSPKFLNRRSRSSYLGIFRKRRIVYFVVVLVICILCFASISFDSTPSSTGHFYLKKRDVLLNKFDPDQPELVSNKAGLVVLDLLDAEEGLKRHPIEDLIKNAKAKAQALEDGALTSLEQAVDEYRRMYNMEPPKGFDLWFSAFPAHVQPKLLRPAHDPIVPFLALKGSAVRARLPMMDKQIAAFSMHIDKGKIAGLKGHDASGGRAKDLSLLIGPVAHLLPPMKIYFNVDDSPHSIVTSDVYQRAYYYGSRGEIWPEEDRARYEDHQERGANNWVLACDRDSPAARSLRDVILDPSEKEELSIARPKSFIADHHDAMDYCESPELLKSHSLLIFGNPNPAPMLPIFGTCRSKWNHDIPATPLAAINQTVQHIPWAEKKINKAFWRGKMTGLMASEKLDWRQSQRIRLHHLTNPSRRPNEAVSVLEQDPDTERWVATKRNMLEVSNQMFDIGLVDGPLQCSKGDGTCSIMEQEIDFAPRVEWDEGVDQQFQYKYTIDVDGNGWSSRFRRTLLSGSVVLKSTVYPEWYSQILIPWYHYVPVKNSFSDLVDIIAFFETRPDLANEIADAGRQFVLDNWQWQDMQSYMILLLLEYARALADDRDSATWKGEGSQGMPATHWD